MPPKFRKSSNFVINVGSFFRSQQLHKLYIIWLIISLWLLVPVVQSWNITNPVISSYLINMLPWVVQPNCEKSELYFFKLHFYTQMYKNIYDLFILRVYGTSYIKSPKNLDILFQSRSDFAEKNPKNSIGYLIKKSEILCPCLIIARLKLGLTPIFGTCDALSMSWTICGHPQLSN